MKVYLALPRCFCAGVERAIRIVELALERFGPPAYVRKEIVHNRYVVDCLRRRGAVFVESLEEVPAGNRVIFSAHGVGPEVYEEARRRNLEVIDATCPLVRKVHQEVLRFVEEGCHVILIGRQGHDEVIGTLGQAPGKVTLVENAEQARSVYVPPHEKLAVLTQTTLSVDDTRVVIEALEKRFGEMIRPKAEDICYATQNRQNAVKALCDKGIELLLVVGSQNSSNAARLVEVGTNRGVSGYLINDADELIEDWLAGVEKIGVTGGASTPDEIVQEVVEYLRERGGKEVELCRVAEERTVFSLPGILRDTDVDG